MSKADYDKKFEMMEEADFNGDLEDALGTHALRVQLGMIEGEVALLSIDHD